MSAILNFELKMRCKIQLNNLLKLNFLEVYQIYKLFN